MIMITFECHSLPWSFMNNPFKSDILEKLRLNSKINFFKINIRLKKQYKYQTVL